MPLGSARTSCAGTWPNIDALSLDLPIRTIRAKTHIAEAPVAAGVGPVFLREQGR